MTSLFLPIPLIPRVKLRPCDEVESGTPSAPALLITARGVTDPKEVDVTDCTDGLVRPLPQADKFWAKVEITEGCWYWKGTIGPSGYGVCTWRDNGRVWGTSAHMVAYLLTFGSVPEGHELDHLCHTMDGGCRKGRLCPHRRCVNPGDLQPVTQAENSRRAHQVPLEIAMAPFLVGQPVAEAPTGLRGRPRQTHCKRGHPLVVPNLILRNDGQRACRSCRMMRARGLI